MTRVGVAEWLDKLAEATKARCEIKNYDENKLRACEQLMHSCEGKTIPYVQLSTGLRKAAELLDIEVKVLYEDDDYNDRCIYFIWNDVMFIELEDKEEEE